MHVADPVGESLRVDILEQVTGRAGRERREDLRVVREAREHEHSHSGRNLEQAADRPDPVTSGMTRSRRTTSGADVLATPMASSAPAASPTTSMPSCRRRNARSPSRTTEWSSTMSRRMGAVMRSLLILTPWGVSR